MKDAEPLFLDTNILVYANVLESPFHASALHTIQTAYKAGRPLWISCQVLREYLATMTRPQTFITLPRKMLLEQVRQLAEQFNVADETAKVSGQLAQLLSIYPVGGKQVHDANIIATMLVYGIPSLLTHNIQDFEKFRDRIMIETIA